MTILLCDLPLGIDGIDILLHIANFLILVVGMGLLVYKPVKKFMKTRQDAIQNQIAENEQKQQEVDQMKTEYTARLENVEQEANTIITDSTAKGEQERAKIVEIARKEADNILAEARERAEKESAEAIADVKNDVVDMAVTIAGKIIERQITPEEDQQLIDACIAEWEKKYE